MEHERSVCKLKEYVDALEKERRKIEVFQRELPLSMQLVTHAIEGCKQQIMGSGDQRLVSDGPDDCEVTSNEGPVLEEFIPLKRSSEEEDGKRDGDGDEISFAGEKPDWLRSVQLWTHINDPPSKQERRSVIEPNKSNGAFHPFCRHDKVTKPAASSTTESEGATKEKAGQTGQRKTRRCWSPELHKRFLQALEQLGGFRAATPKQIKELMKVDGLTNDEVKSHLQKYRLHNRRPGHAAQSQSNGDAQAPQFVVVGGIWVPPQKYSPAMGQTPAADSGGQGRKVYAPRPRFPNSRQRQEKVHSAGSGGANSGESPATSTSSHVTATSPAA